MLERTCTFLLDDVGPESAAMACLPTWHSTTWCKRPGVSPGPYPSGRALLRGRGFCVDHHGHWLIAPMRLPLVWRAHKAAAEEIEMRAAKHLAFQHFEAIDMPFDRPRAPG